MLTSMHRPQAWCTGKQSDGRATCEMMSAPSTAPASVTAIVMLRVMGFSSYPSLSPTKACTH